MHNQHQQHKGERTKQKKYQIKKALTPPAVNGIFILQLLTISASSKGCLGYVERDQNS